MEEAKRRGLGGVRPHLSDVDSPARRNLAVALDAILDEIKTEVYAATRVALQDGAADARQDACV
jgi:hypothetical protein